MKRKRKKKTTTQTLATKKINKTEKKKIQNQLKKILQRFLYPTATFLSTPLLKAHILYHSYSYLSIVIVVVIVVVVVVMVVVV